MSLRRRWTGWRNRRLSSPSFQAWASAFPLTRPKARTEAAALFDLVGGFVHAQILAACVELGLLEQLRDATPTTAQIAVTCNLPPDSARRLLRGAASLELVEPLGDGWTLGPRGAALLGNPGVAAMIAHHRAFYADMADPVALLRRGGGGGELADYWSYARAADARATTPDAVAPYSALMAASQPMVAAEVIAAAGLNRFRRLLDVGGGEGAFIEAVARGVPGLDLALFDLPAVATRARLRLDTANLNRVATFGGSFFGDSLPTGFDAISLVRILHDHDDTPALELLRSIRAALPPGGALLIAEPMAEDRPARVGDAYFGFYLLAMGSGRARSPAEIASMLRSAGFASSRQLPTRLPLVTSLIEARA